MVHVHHSVLMVLWRDAKKMSTETSDIYESATVRDAERVERVKPRLVWITPRKGTLRDRRFNDFLSFVGMRHLIAGEILREQQRLLIYRPIRPDPTRADGEGQTNDQWSE
jgi:hypothetical protein